MARLQLTVFGLTAHPLCSVSPEDANILTVLLRVGQVMFLSHQHKFKLFLSLQPHLRSTILGGKCPIRSTFSGDAYAPSLLLPLFLLVTELLPNTW